jgi:hypothetical protein
LQDLDEFLVDSLLELPQALFEPIDHVTHQVQEGVEHAQFNKVGMIFLMLPYLILPALFLVALMMSVCGLYSVCYNNLLQWVCVPMLVLWTMLAYLGAAWMAVAVEGNADFCAGGATDTPEASVTAILDQYNLSEGQFYPDVLQFYVGQCRASSNPWKFLLSYQHDLLEAQSNVMDIMSQLELEGVTQLSQDCGLEYEPFFVLITMIAKELEQLTLTAARSIDLIKCESIVPLYTSTVYDTTCHDTIRAGAWGYGSLFAVAFFGMLAIMYRGAYQPIFFEDDDSVVDKSLAFPSTSQDDEDMEDLKMHEADGEDDDMDVVVTTGGEF